MWQRFTERARQVVFAAQQHAGNMKLNEVSTEHLLLGIADDLTNKYECNQAIRILESFGVEREALMLALAEKVRESFTASPPESKGQDDMYLSSQAKKAIDFSYDEARELDSNYIGTEHLLLGILREESGIGGATLRGLGVTLDGARDWLRAQKGEPGTDSSSDQPLTKVAPENGLLAKTAAYLRRMLRVPPFPEGQEPTPDAPIPPIVALDLQFERTALLFLSQGREGADGMVQDLRSQSQVALPHDTQVQVITERDDPAADWRHVRVLNGDNAGRILFVPAFFLSEEDAESFAAPLPGTPKGRLRQSEETAKGAAILRGVLRVPSAPSGREPIPNAAPKPALALELSDAEMIRMEGLLARQEAKAYAEMMTGKARLELPPNTEVEILDHTAPVAEYWRKVRVLSGENAGKILFVPLSSVRAAPEGDNPAADAPLPDAPENRPRRFEGLLRAALAVNSDSFDLTAGNPLILKNALTEDEIRAIVDEIITLPQREAVERGEVVEAWCGIPQTAYNDHMEFNVDVYKIRGRLTARFRRAGR